MLRSGGLLDPGAAFSPGGGFMMIAPSGFILPDESCPCSTVPLLSGLPLFSPFSGLVISGPPCPTAPPDPLPLPIWACTGSCANKSSQLAINRDTPRCLIIIALSLSASITTLSAEDHETYLVFVGQILLSPPVRTSSPLPRPDVQIHGPTVQHPE